MLIDKPKWVFQHRNRVVQGDGRVCLFDGRAIGQWVCHDRTSGRLIWRRSILRANSMVGVASGVIVATEFRDEGSWSSRLGCYGISLLDGRLLWVSHAAGYFGRLLRALDFVPGFANEFRDTPVCVSDGKVFFSSGRSVSVETGIELANVDASLVPSIETTMSLNGQLRLASYSENRTRVAAGSGLYLSVDRADRGFTAENELGGVLWRFNTLGPDRNIEGTIAGYFVHWPEIFLLVSEEPALIVDPKNSLQLVFNPTRWRLVAIDVSSGRLIQEISLGEELLTECRIEDIDADGLLVQKFPFGERKSFDLIYFERSN